MTERETEIKRNTLHTFVNREEKEIKHKMSLYIEGRHIIIKYQERKRQ
jgi:hypothetical protein